MALVPACAWDQGANIAVTVNGQSVGTKLPGADGAVTVTVTVVSATELSIDDPVSAPASCGTNTVSGVGQSSVGGGAVTGSSTFTLNCPAGAAQTGSPLARTGATIGNWSGTAVALVVSGLGLVALSRRRRQGGFGSRMP
ncbi:MAG TPA: LPXTG cell wall anchor domain-containing protein [Acidimicrobiales bacterium]|nr:LPXTG cell wall anchor domain-containing protein [Acidimicrobiales bacterium]